MKIGKLNKTILLTEDYTTINLKTLNGGEISDIKVKQNVSKIIIM